MLTVRNVFTVVNAEMQLYSYCSYFSFVTFWVYSNDSMLTPVFFSPLSSSSSSSIGVFALPGDPYSSDKLAASIATQQLVAYDDNQRTVFVKTALDRQHKLASLSIYSTLSKGITAGIVVWGILVGMGAVIHTLLLVP